MSPAPVGLEVYLQQALDHQHRKSRGIPERGCPPVLDCRMRTVGRDD